MLNVPLAHDAEVSSRRKAITSSPLGLTHAGLIVLLVENDPQLRRALSILVESWGVSVIEAEDAESALDLMDDLQIAPDALLLDYQLGAGLNGTQLFEELTRRLGRLPCAIVSAERSVNLRQETRRLEIDLLLKPLDRSKLIDFLHAAAQETAH